MDNDGLIDHSLSLVDLAVHELNAAKPDMERLERMLTSARASLAELSVRRRE